MTQRQENLKDEIIRIADILQLGIRHDDRDWFYMFIQRINGQWGRLREFHFISQDFIDEFEQYRWYGFSQFLLNKDKPLSYVEQFMNNEEYYAGFKFDFLMELAKDIRLTDDFVIKYEKSFDFTHTHSGENGCQNIKENAWHYILANPSISREIKLKYKNKPTIALTIEEKRRKSPKWMQRLEELSKQIA